MNKLKKMIMSILVVFMVIGGFGSDLALATNYSQVPEIKIGANGTLDTAGMAKENKAQAFNKILYEYRGVVTFISGIALVSMIMFFIFNLIALGNSKGNPQERQKAVTGLIVSGIATAGLGSVTLIVTLFFNLMGDKGVS